METEKEDAQPAVAGGAWPGVGTERRGPNRPMEASGGRRPRQTRHSGAALRGVWGLGAVVVVARA